MVCAKSPRVAAREPITHSSFFWSRVKLKSAGFLLTPICTMRPLGADASTHAQNDAGTPAASTVTSKPSPCVISSAAAAMLPPPSLSRQPSTGK